MSNETIARRYASALADVALGGDVKTVKSELAAFAEMLAPDTELWTVFANPSIAHAGKEKVLEELIARSKPSKTTANFLRVLLQNSRIADLAEINDRFAAVLEERSGIISAEIISARALADAERSEFEKSLNALTGKSVNINFAVDQEIIGGVVTRIGSTVYDNSVRTKLENLREQLVNG